MTLRSVAPYSLAAALLLLWPLEAVSQTTGQAEAGAQYFDDSLYSSPTRGVFGVFSYYVPHGGLFEGTINALVNDQNEFKLGRNMMALRDYPAGGARWTIAGGDLMEPLDRPPFRFTNDIPAVPLFRGLSVQRDSGAMLLSLQVGRNEQLLGANIPWVALAPESLLNALATIRLGSFGTAEANGLFVRNTEAGTTPSVSGAPVPEQSQSLGAGLTVGTSGPLAGQARVWYSWATYPAASGVAPGSFLSFITGGRYLAGPWRIEADYLRYGSTLVPLSTIYVGNREGPYASAEYRTDLFAVTGLYQQQKSNPEGFSDVPDIRSTIGQAMLNTTLWARQSLSVSYSDQRITSDRSGSLSDYAQRRTEIQTLLSVWGLTRLDFVREWNRNPDLGFSLNQFEVQQTVSFRAFAVSAGVRYQRDSLGATSTAIEAGLNGEIGPVGLFLNGQWGNDLAGTSVFTVNHGQQVTYGASVRLPAGLHLRVEGYHNDSKTFLSAETIFVNPDIPIYSLSRNTLLVRLSKTFTWGQGLNPMAYAGAPGSLPSPVPFGIVRGIAFADLNGNGVRDPGEPGVPGVTLRLDGGVDVVTDDDGSYRYSNVLEGTHEIALVLDRLPAAYDAPVRVQARIDVRRLEAGTFDFPLVPLGSITGRVERVNADVVEGERDVVIVLEPSGLATRTDEDGRFEFDNVRPGEFVTRLEADSLPESAKLEGDAERTVRVGAGETKSLASYRFRIVVEEKPIQKILDSQETVSPSKPKKKAPPKPPADSKPHGGTNNRRPSR